MQYPIVREYKTDIKQENSENLIQGELVVLGSGARNRVFAPRHPPFFVESLKITTKTGAPLFSGKDKDYEIYSLMPELTGLAGKEVATLIKLNTLSLNEVVIDYHTLGDNPIIDKTLIDMFLSVLNDQRPIDWDDIINKDSHFTPKLHKHSLLYNIHSFKDTLIFLDKLLIVIKNNQDMSEFRLKHFHKLIDWYVNLYGNMLVDFLNQHSTSYDAHGLTAKQVDLELVDNFTTATPSTVLQLRKDQHLRPTELKTLVDNYSFNANEFFPKQMLPVAEYGNTNFIPPSIDGSFEGLGGISETAGICMESDSSIVMLWNRMDGRVRGLYFSVVTDTADPAKTKLTYTGYKYTHPKFVADNANVDLICGGSGSETILVCDSVSNKAYLGLTNGTLDPSKHVYATLNVQPLMNSIFSNPGAAQFNTLMEYINVLLMGEWVYLILTSANNSPAIQNPPAIAQLVYRQFYRVKISDIKLGGTVTPVRQNVSFTNADGQTFTNATHHKWYSVSMDAGGHVTKGLLTFTPVLPTAYVGNYRSQIAISGEDPSRPGIYGLKFLSHYYVNAIHPTLNINTFISLAPEITYDFNPITGVMTLKSKTDLPPSINFNNTPALPPQYIVPSEMAKMTAWFDAQANMLLEDGRMLVSATPGSQGYPRAAALYEYQDSRSKYSTVMKVFSNKNSYKKTIDYTEVAASPLESSTYVKNIMYWPGAEYYVSGVKTDPNKQGLYKRTVVGKLELRPGVTNLTIPNLLSRPLSSNVRKINAVPGMGGLTITAQPSQLESFDMEVGQSALCIGVQRAYLDRNKIGSSWGTPVGMNDVILTSTHTEKLELDGTVTLVPGKEILYPSAIVEQLKNLVQYPVIKGRARDCIVTICDPSQSDLEKFGWIPTVVVITYADALSQPTKDNLYLTCATITPTYTNIGNRYTVTGFTVLDLNHQFVEGGAVFTKLYVANSEVDYSEITDLLEIAPSVSIGTMRGLMYIVGNTLGVRICTSVIGRTLNDLLGTSFYLEYTNKSSKRWSSVVMNRSGTGDGGYEVTPQNGIRLIASWGTTTGGAATIVQGPNANVMIGSAYPETGWGIFFKSEIKIVFNGAPYMLPAGTIDLRDIDPAPQNKTFYIYAKLTTTGAVYEVSLEKRLESNFQLWVGTAVTNDTQILTLERFNVTAIDGHRVSEARRGNSIPASSGLVNEAGQLPWLRESDFT